MKFLNDVNGKLSSKRLAAWVTLSVGLFMGVASGFETLNYSETLILGLVGIAGGVLFGTVFEKYKVGDNPPPDDEQDNPG